MYITGRVAGVATQVLLELRVAVGAQGLDASFKSDRPELASFVFEAVSQVLTGA